MKPRTISQLSTASTILLGRDLALAAEGLHLPAPLQRSLADMGEACATLETARKSGDAGEEKVTSTLFLRVRAVRKAVGMLRDAIHTFARLPEGQSLGEHGRQLEKTVLKGGTEFSSRSTEELVIGAEALVQRAKEKANAALLARLACGPFVTELRTAFSGLEEERKASLAPSAATVDEATMFELRAVALAAIRVYVGKVESAANLDLIDASGPLAPLDQRRVSSKAKRSEPVEDTPDEGPSSRAA